YALWVYRKVIFGALEKPELGALKDLDGREIIALAPLVVLTILFGVFPKAVLDLSAASVTTLVDNYSHALGAAKAAALMPCGQARGCPSPSRCPPWCRRCRSCCSSSAPWRC